ncbi:hypothetical protein E2C01_042916 [Portunus trituberculatus]|uniref:Uncharacterized protein n=1 Tax=Portunus trituberculatus TaxID=210409 RepID=A0A5B7FRH4_PORTR|nr:hypothetical protein [Portunus trituberculatus]
MASTSLRRHLPYGYPIA